jgi:hypothetical protein
MIKIIIIFIREKWFIYLSKVFQMNNINNTRMEIILFLVIN